MVASSAGLWAPAALRIARSAVHRASKIVRTKLANATRPVNTALEPVFIRNTNPRQPIHPNAFLRQAKSRRWNSNSAYQNINAAVRRFISTGRLEGTPRIDRTKFLKTKVGRSISQFSGRAPFASTLRPNLTGGALPRTAGGYGLGSGRVGGARYFSHAPAAQAQVVQNVSSAVRAFWLSGSRAQFDGMTSRGERRYRAVSAVQDDATRKMAAVTRPIPGSYVDFRLNPTITALSPLAAAFPYTPAGVKAPVFDATSLNTDGFIDVLSGDFARALQDLTTLLGDIKKLSSLGDLPINLEKDHVLRVRFPGVDADTVETLLDDLGLTKGVVHEDPEFNAETGVEVALRFPFAPDSKASEASPFTSPGGSLRSEDSYPAEHELFEEFDDLSEIADNPRLSWKSLEGYESMSPPFSSGQHCSEDFEGLEGVYRFMEECERARGHFHG
ncbi:hypothetical protein F5Y15DRAFT_392413 [Xylariaceae sp. FL0016]|nr:hypothetical protein F5Y15DRAFT_392413 [Xylariaceae sp. FL0016]